MHAIAWQIRARTHGARWSTCRPRSSCTSSSRRFAQGHHELQGAVPLGRPVDGRRRPVHRRQGQHPGGVLPYLQRPGRSRPADRDLGDRSPSELAGLEERVRSRLGWGLVADIQPTTYELRLGILQSKAQQSPARPRFPTTSWPSSPIASPRTCASSKARSTGGRPGDPDGPRHHPRMAQDVLRDLLRAHERRVTIEEIQKEWSSITTSAWPR